MWNIATMLLGVKLFKEYVKNLKTLISNFLFGVFGMIQEIIHQSVGRKIRSFRLKITKKWMAYFESCSILKKEVLLKNIRFYFLGIASSSNPKLLFVFAA